MHDLTGKNTSRLMMALLVVFVLISHGGGLRNGFVWDDEFTVVNNPHLNGVESIPRLLLAEDRPPDGKGTGFYRPLTALSFFLDKAVWGDSAFGFHLTSILLHILTAALLFCCCRELRCEPVASFGAALWFALHPATVEAVAFVSARNVLLCGLFSLLALLMYLRGHVRLAVIPFMLALLSKELAVVLPLLFWLHDRMSGQRNGGVARLLPYVGGIGIYLVLRAAFVLPAEESLLRGLVAGLFQAPMLLPRYLLNALLPFWLKTAYPDSMTGSGLLEAGIGLMLLALLLAFGYYLYCRGRFSALLGLAWFGLFLAPPLLLLAGREQILADRHLHLALLGAALLLGQMLGDIRERWRILTVLMIAAPFLVMTQQKVPVWKDNQALFGCMIADAPTMPAGYLNLLRAAQNNGDFKAAESWLERGMRTGAIDGRGAASARLNLLCYKGERLLAAGQHEQAALLFNQVLAINPTFVPALVNMGNVQAERGDYRSAEAWYMKALLVDQNNPAARENMVRVRRLLVEKGGT